MSKMFLLRYIFLFIFTETHKILYQFKKNRVMYLFFDTETTGLPRNWKAPITDLNNWPRMVQLAYLLYDRKGNIIKAGDYIIKPEGFEIPSDASKVHGITTARALQEGKRLEVVLNDFRILVEDASSLIAHNISFDEKIVGAEFLRNRMPNILENKIKICTMRKTVDFCAINGPYGYKYPKLSELHYKLFGVGFNEEHNAAADIKATARCYWELKRMGKI